MSIDSVLRLPDPPDLLHRFVDIPLQTMVMVDGKCILVQSNHQGCLEMLSNLGVARADGNCEFKWTMVCDPDLPTEMGEACLVESAPVALLSFGRACFMALHRSQMELTGFVSSGVGEESFREVILPRVRKLIKDVAFRRA